MALLDGKLRAFDKGGRNAVVDYVDHTANGTAAVEKRRGASYHFDSFGQQRLHGVSMIGTLRRHVDNIYVILKNLYAVGRLASNDGLPNTCTEGTNRHTNFVLQSRTE